MVLKSDNFDDNAIDTTFWDELKSGTGTVVEQNQRLESNCPADGDTAGLVTKNSHDLTSADIKVDVLNDDLSGQNLAICLTKSVTGLPAIPRRSYIISKNNAANWFYVQRCIDYTVTTIYQGPWSGASGSLRIVISGGTIYFYEEDTLLVSESYQLGSYDCYVYIFCVGTTGFLGMDYFDNFKVPLLAPKGTIAIHAKLAGIT